MEELIASVAQKTGLDAAKARQAVETVLNFVKSKLPAPVASQIDGLISGSGGGGIGDAVKNLGDMFGKKS
jgi:hypothetical protein